tara:strand:+ start:152 stop:493 length:342 start_codon:yes stop_codon:yes gene_type:complete
MATFPDYNPQYSATKRSQPNQRITQFGDGYQQRTTFGLNQDPKRWSLTFNVDDEDATEIETFLEARAEDGASFDWSPPDTATTFKWICRSFSREIFEFDRNRVTATFEQVFEP